MRELRFLALNLSFPNQGGNWLVHYHLFADMVAVTHRWRVYPP